MRKCVTGKGGNRKRIGKRGIERVVEIIGDKERKGDKGTE